MEYSTWDPRDQSSATSDLTSVQPEIHGLGAGSKVSKLFS